MSDNECIFCKIVRGELPCHKVYEDDDHLAFLDIYPIVKGQTLVITKNHYGSYQFDLPDDVYTKLFLTAKKVGKAIDKALGSIRTFLVVEGMEINHIHVKLYPVFEIKRCLAPPEIDYKIVNNWYSGYITTLHGPRAKDEDLEKIAEKIRSIFMD
ncbi:MAG: HIT domain-containing protein [Candidatus Aenigmatarchaeota archaeon]